MADNFKIEERKEVVSKLLKHPKFNAYDIDQKIDLLRTHFVIFKEIEEQKIEDYIYSLAN